MHPSVEKMVKGFQPLTMKYPCFNCPQSLKGKHNTKCEGTCELFAKYTEERKNMVSKDSWSAYNAYLTDRTSAWMRKSMYGRSRGH